MSENMTISDEAVQTHDVAIGTQWRRLLREIVNINSGFTNVAGQRRVFDVLTPHFRRLGFRGRSILLDDGRKAMVFEWPDAAPEVILVGHVDTMFQPDSPFQTLGEREDVLSGPGISDMKAGLVLILMLLERLEDPHLLRRIRVFINDDEELGARYSRHELKRHAEDLRFALIFEPGLTDGSYVLGLSLEHPVSDRGTTASRMATRYYDRDEVTALARDLIELRDGFASARPDTPPPAALRRLPGERLAPSGCAMVVGLGPYGGKTHTTDEFLRPETFDERLAAAELLTRSLLEGSRGRKAPA